MANLTHLADADYRNENWALVGTSVTRLYEAWNNDDDTKYAKCPSSQGRAAVMFPTNITSLPTGATITSVSVYVRANKTSSNSRSLTVNLLSTDNTACFTSRTIYLSQDITTYEVGTYTKDVLGKVWTVSRLNKLVAQIYSYGKTADAVRAYKVYVLVNYHTYPSVSVTAPVGTQVTASPTIEWNYVQTDGDLQTEATWKIFTEEAVIKTTFSPELSVPVAKGVVTGDRTTHAMTESLGRGKYYAYVKVKSSFGAVSSWANRLFSVQPELPGPPDVSTAADNTESKTTLDIVNGTNLLSVQQSSAEHGSDAAEYTLTNCTIARSNDVFYGNGTASYKLTRGGSASTMAVTSSFIPVAPDVDITTRVQVQSPTTVRAVTTTLTYYDEHYVSIGTPLTATSTSTLDEWEEYLATGTTPVGALYMKLAISIASPGASEVHYIDGVGIMYNDSTPWSIGGHFSRNLLSTTYSAHSASAGWTAAAGTTLSDRTTVSETGADGPNALRLTASTISSSISVRAVGTTFTSNSNLNTFTLNKPAGTATGDLMIAILTSTDAGVLYPPAGWTYVNTAAQDTPDVDTGLWILCRTATASEPASWDCTVSDPATGRRATVISYIGASENQFIAENVKTHYGAPTLATTQTVYNDDANAWRIAAFSARDDASGGSWSGATDGLPGSVQYISYVGAASAWKSTGTKTSFQINRPSGIASGDLMIATIGIHGSVSTINAPSGWTKVQHKISGGTYPTTMAVFTRTAGGSEPTSWTGSTNSAGSGTRLSQCLAYRGAADHSLQFVAEAATASSNTYSTNYSGTGTITNTDGRSWRIAAFTANAADLGYFADCNENRERRNNSVSSYSDSNAMTVAVYDSGGVVSTGSHKRTAYWYNESYSGSYSYNYASSCAWIGLIRASPNAPASGVSQPEIGTEGVAGTGSHYISTMICGSNGEIPVGDSAVTAQYSLSSPQNVVSWVGIIRPSTPLSGGEVKATMNTGVDISRVADEVLEQAGNRITIMADFLGSAPGTAYLTLKCYEANQLLSTMTAEGGSYVDSIWTPATATFTLPDGTTSLVGEVSSRERAIGDTVDVDRVGLMFGETTYWRSGSSTDLTHAIWSRAVIQYADDLGDGEGYGPWRDLYGTVSKPPIYDPLTGRLTYVDHTPIPLVTRKYRVSTLVNGLLGDVFQSPWSDESNEISITPMYWWLKDPLTPTRNMILPVKADAFPVEASNTASVFQPLGEDFPVVLSEGFKSDTVTLTLILTRPQWLAFQVLARSGRTLYLQSDVDQAWWVRISENLGSSTIVTYDRQNNPLREVEVTFVQVAPED